MALWLAGNLRSVERADEASAALARAAVGGARAADIERARRLFSEARRFGPDAQLKVNEAGILAVAEVNGAAALLREAVREEPDNVEAWVLMYGLSGGAAGARARARSLELDPKSRQLLDGIDAAR